MVTPRENRIHMMLSEEELTVIDDWRFKNRIGSRSGAIRRLCEIALKNDPQMMPLISAKSRLIQSFRDFLQNLEAKKAILSVDAYISVLEKIETVSMTRIDKDYVASKTIEEALEGVLNSLDYLDKIVAQVSMAPTNHMDGKPILFRGVQKSE